MRRIGRGVSLSLSLSLSHSLDPPTALPHQRRRRVWEQTSLKRYTLSHTLGCRLDWGLRQQLQWEEEVEERGELLQAAMPAAAAVAAVSTLRWTRMGRGS